MISLKSTLFAALLLSLQIPSNYSSAQVSQTSKDQLTEVSRIEFIDGNAGFLTVEMLKDGLLQEKEKFYMQYDSKKITLNGKDIPEPYNSRYVQMLKNGDFVNDSSSFGSIRSDGQSISELAEKKSNHVHGSYSYHHTFSRLAKLLVEDGIADNTDNMTLDIAADYVAVNGKVLTSPIEKAYEYHFRNMIRFQPKQGEVMTISIKYSAKM